MGLLGFFPMGDFDGLYFPYSTWLRSGHHVSVCLGQAAWAGMLNSGDRWQTVVNKGCELKHSSAVFREQLGIEDNVLA